jgi:2-aminoadipate transaminase
MSANELPLASWARRLEPSAIQDMLQNITRPGVLSLALGLPAAEFFPTEPMSGAVARVLAEQPLALQYGSTLGPSGARWWPSWPAGACAATPAGTAT